MNSVSVVGAIIGGEDAQTKLAAKQILNFMYSWAMGMQKLQVLALVPTASVSTHNKPPGENFTT